MMRPSEYDNLIRTRALEEVPQTPGAIEGFLKDAAESLEVGMKRRKNKTPEGRACRGS